MALRKSSGPLFCWGSNMIRRSKHTSNFTTLPNELVNDTSLSADELGMALYLLSKPPEWVVVPGELRKRFNCGRDKIRRILNGLEKAGYLVRVKKFTKEGRFAKVDFEVFDVPQTENPSPETEKPSPVNPSPENPTLNKERKIENTESTKTADGGFDELWGIVPRRVGKGAARTAYGRALKKTDHETIMAGMGRYAREVAAADPKFICHPASWLNGERWTDEPPPPKRLNRNQLAG